MKTAILLLAIVVAVSAFTEVEYQQKFVEWMKKHDKVYDAGNLFHRYNIFKQSFDWCEQHNKEGHSYKVGLNIFSDETMEEFTTYHTGFSANKYNNAIPHVMNVDIPTSVDWVASGRVSRIKDQGQCGSCWTFSAAGAMESAYAITYSTSAPDLSEQNILDCCSGSGCAGCNGGSMNSAFEWSKAGICPESAYPYTALQGRCLTTCKKTVKVTSYSSPSGESGLINAIASQPVSIALGVSNTAFKNYVSGVIDSSACNTALDHALIAVGYTSTTYKIKNSWGTWWGESGYVRVVRGKKMCKIGDWSVYPKVAKL